MNSSTLSEALEIARLRLEAAESEFEAAKQRALAAETPVKLREALFRVRAAAKVLLEAIDDYVTARLWARFGAQPI